MRKLHVSLLILSATSPLFGGTGQKSFTPTSFKIPITAIVLQGDGGSPSSQVYTCTPSATDNCEVDILDAASIATIQAKLATAKAQTGTYTQIFFNCSTGQSAAGSTGYLKFKGTATSGTGTAYYTASGSVPVGTDATKNDYVTANLLGCGSTNNLVTPLTVASGDDLTISLFVNQNMNTWLDPLASPGMGGCVVATGPALGLGVCANYPTIFPYIGATAPTMDTYYIAHTTGDVSKLTVANANAIVKVAIDAGGTPFLASTGPFFSETSVTYLGDLTKGGPNYSSSTTSFSVNADKTIAFQVGMTTDKGPLFSAFKLASHTGKLTSSGTTVYYAAFKQ